MISVVIPALNEAATVASVVAAARRCPGVAEVIVVDDGSTDGTPELARAAGARVITSTLLGKGASMQDGVRAARGDAVAFLDADLSLPEDDLVGRLAAPVLSGAADLVKARFSRGGGRVTALTARPLLAAFFPELAHFAQPLGGLAAGRRSFLLGLPFEADYGADVALLIDAAARGGALAEVDVGRVEHDSQPLEALGEMARQVARVILDRAARHGRLHPGQLSDADEADDRARFERGVSLAGAGSPRRLALFDMDGVLLRGRFVVSLARRTGRLPELGGLLDDARLDPDGRARRIASLFAGVPREAFRRAALGMALNPGAARTVVALRKAGFLVGVVTDSYREAAEVVRRRVFADFSVSHRMGFRRGLATGEAQPSPLLAHPNGCRAHRLCKLNALLHLAGRLGLAPGEVVAVGDGENDACMLRAAGCGIAFQPKSAAVAAAARHVIRGDLAGVLRPLKVGALSRSA